MNNNEYLIAALKKEANFHADLAKEKSADDDMNYHLRKMDLFTACAEALRSAESAREALKNLVDITSRAMFNDVTDDLSRALSSAREALLTNKPKAEPVKPEEEWKVGADLTTGVYIQSKDFSHDARLYINCDFPSLQQELGYAIEIASLLNAALQSRGK